MAAAIDPRVPRTALVTGAARRIGRDLALSLGEAGWNVAVHYNGSADEAQEVVETIRLIGAKAVALQADLRSEPEMLALLARTRDALGPIGCLVNNASTFENDFADTVTRESWDSHMEPNLRAPFVLCQQFEHLLPGDAHGVIVNMLDQRVLNLTPYFISYTLSKAGLWTLTQTLALAWAPRIRVNAIGPGLVLPAPRQSAEHFAKSFANAPLGHGTRPEEIVDALHYILRARAMTGSMVSIDGGQHLGWAQASSSKEPE